MQNANRVDHGAIRSAQLLTILTLAASGLTGRWEPVALLAGVFLVTALYFPAGPFILVYRWLLRPLGIMRPDLRVDHLQPHRFGQAVGAVGAAAAAGLLYLGYTAAGLLVVAVLIFLTAVSFSGWCIGCFIYFQLYRLGLRGFFGKAPTDPRKPAGSRPGKDLADG
ncbi:MAG: DUF4395 domain-containing protein [Gammaproteobacteria bacterium]|jgi:hypothetical protein|nr:DUF4395 domain-containing protein [Gammaproteobacteria bacterium]